MKRVLGEGTKWQWMWLWQMVLRQTLVGKRCLTRRSEGGLWRACWLADMISKRHFVPALSTELCGSCDERAAGEFVCHMWWRAYLWMGLQIGLLLRNVKATQELHHPMHRRWSNQCLRHSPRSLHSLQPQS